MASYTKNLNLIKPVDTDPFTVEHANSNMEKIDNAYSNLKVLQGIVAPTTSTIGIIGQFYLNTATKALYQCTNVNGTTYTWDSVLPAIIGNIGQIKDNTSYNDWESISTFFNYTNSYDVTYNTVTLSPDKRKLVFAVGSTLYLIITDGTTKNISSRTVDAIVQTYVSNDMILALSATVLYIFTIENDVLVYHTSKSGLFTETIDFKPFNDTAQNSEFMLFAAKTGDGTCKGSYSVFKVNKSTYNVTVIGSKTLTTSPNSSYTSINIVIPYADSIVVTSSDYKDTMGYFYNTMYKSDGTVTELKTGGSSNGAIYGKHGGYGCAVIDAINNLLYCSKGEADGISGTSYFVVINMLTNTVVYNTTTSAVFSHFADNNLYFGLTKLDKITGASTGISDPTIIAAKGLSLNGDSSHVYKCYNVYNFTNYVSWMWDTSSSKSPICVCFGRLMKSGGIAI